MVETISPVVHGGRGRWLGTLVLHALGATGTAAAFGAALGLIGRSLDAPWGRPGLVTLGAVAAVYALGTLLRLDVPVPQLRRQVPDWWRTYFGRPIAAVLYGAGLGVGFLTYLSSGTLVVVAYAAIATGSPAVGALIVAPFGLVRGLSALVAWRSITQEQSRALVDRLVATSDVARRVTNGGLLLVIASIAVATAFQATAASWWAFFAAVLAAVFTWAAAWKVVSPRRWRRALAAFGRPRSIERIAVWAVPSSEALVPLLVVAGLPRVAAIWSGMLLAVFSVAVVASRGRMGGGVACGCFGGRGSVALRTVLVRNVLLLAMAASVAVRGEDAPAVRLPGSPAVGDALPLVLTLSALAASMLVAWRASVWFDRGRRA
jgi:Methylamine utilisation protein MauE